MPGFESNEKDEACLPGTSRERSPLLRTNPQKASRTGHRESRREILILPGRNFIEREVMGSNVKREASVKVAGLKVEDRIHVR